MVFSKKLWVLTVSALLLSPIAFSQSNSDIDFLRKQITDLQARLSSVCHFYANYGRTFSRYAPCWSSR